MTRSGISIANVIRWSRSEQRDAVQWKRKNRLWSVARPHRTQATDPIQMAKGSLFGANPRAMQ
jgi:hypothetical protein